ncbi:MAG TPA: peptidoglycan DD-metalloendopeptidase family protein [Thermoanaerobaculia bacterium]|jgi:septal ring factor EnvC (AmiA/AmiB activator)
MNRLLLVAFFFPAATAVAQAPSPEQQRHEDLARIQARIGALEKRLEESQKNVATAEDQLKRLDWRLELATEQNRALAASREELSQRLVTLSAERGAAAAAVEKSRRTLVARARVLHRFGRFGYFRILLEARDVNALLSSVDRLDALARRDGDLLARDRAARERLSADLAREQSVKKEIDQLYSRSRRESVRIAALKQERERFLDRQRRFAVSGREEVVSLTDKAARLERLLEALSRGESAEPASPSGSIRPWKGVLDWPARGTLVETYGRHRHPKFDAWTFSNGIALSLPEGTPVRAVYAGKAVYAQWLAEYGNLVILDHGDGVLTLYAWLRGISVVPGTYVPVGSPVGSAGVGPGREEPGVYFEVRDRQKAQDPVAWLR